MEKAFYIYAYLNPLVSGRFTYNTSFGIISFDFEPFYIGKGSGNRMTKGMKRIRNNNLKKMKIESIISKAGHLPFCNKIINDLSEKEAFKIEIELIQLIGKIIDGKGPLTNLKDGGEGKSGVYGYKGQWDKKVFQYDLEGNFIRSYSSTTEVEKLTPYKQGEISEACRREVPRYQFQWFYEDKGAFTDATFTHSRASTYKKVIKLTLTDEPIEVFSSMSDAAKSINGQISKISECCSGKLSKYKQFKWKFL